MHNSDSEVKQLSLISCQSVIRQAGTHVTRNVEDRAKSNYNLIWPIVALWAPTSGLQPFGPPLCMYPWCMYVCMILNPDAWCMMRGMVHASMMRNFSVTEGPTEKVILGDAYIHDACMHDAYIYAPWSLCICQWCINVWCIHPLSLRLDYAACVCELNHSQISRIYKCVLTSGIPVLRIRSQLSS